MDDDIHFLGRDGKEGRTMMYQIIYAEGRCSNMANGRKDLRDWLKLLKDEVITDIRKVYKNGVSVSIKKKPW